MIGNVYAISRHVVKPMHAEQVAWVCRILVCTRSNVTWDESWVRQLGKRWQHHIVGGAFANAFGQRPLVHDGVSQAKLAGEGI